MSLQIKASQLATLSHKFTLMNGLPMTQGNVHMKSLEMSQNHNINTNNTCTDYLIGQVASALLGVMFDLPVTDLLLITVMYLK